MKLTDYVVDFLVKKGVTHVFGLTGGAVVHLFDSVSKNSAIQAVFCHHEQAAALAAAAYARIRNNLGAAIVTTGPGSTNAVTGVVSAWQDSIPCIFISGQSRKQHTSLGKPLRQVGAQELDIISIVKPITKYAEMLDAADNIRYHLEKAVYLAVHGRPGPVWLDIPLDFQWAQIDPAAIGGFNPSELPENSPSAQYVAQNCKRCVDLLSDCERPLILAGYGIRLAQAEKEFEKFIEKSQIPFISSWTASDLIDNDSPLYTGRLGIAGQRGGNLAVQNCDLLIAVGSHLSIPLTGAMFNAFAREAKIVVVDIDKNAIDYAAVRIDVPVLCDAKTFLNEMVRQISNARLGDFAWWREKCARYKTYNKTPGQWYSQKKYVNPYVFMDVLSEESQSGDVIVVDGGGSNLYISFQGFKVKAGQRLTLSSGICAMGTGLPESVGACFANNKRRTICTTGDGSCQLNIQELQTIYHHNLPVKIFVMNNRGYLAIRHTQQAFLKGNYVGSSEEGGLSLPDFVEVAKAYRIKAVRINTNAELREKISAVLNEPGPALCEIMVSPDQQLICTQGFDENADGTFTARPLEDMSPFLDRREFLEIMVAKPAPQSVGQLAGVNK